MTKLLVELVEGFLRVCEVTAEADVAAFDAAPAESTLHVGAAVKESGESAERMVA